MPDASTIAALAAGFGIGGILGVIFRAEHERAERRRDRMIEVAEELTIALQAAHAALHVATVPVRWHDRTNPSKTLMPAHDDEELRKAKAALDDVMEKAAAADAIVPRYSLIFPAQELASSPVLAPFRVTNAIRGAVGATGGLLHSPPGRPPPEGLLDLLHSHMSRAGREFGAFNAGANRLIWKRWYSPLTDGVRRLRRGTRKRLSRRAREPEFPFFDENDSSRDEVTDHR